MSLAAKLRPSFETDDDRRSPRTRMLLEGGARQDGGAFHDITIHDLSRDGFRAESGMELSPGMIVEVDIPGIGARNAQVMWAGHPYAGCAFAEPLLHEQVRTALDASPVVWGPFGKSDGKAAEARGVVAAPAPVDATGIGEAADIADEPRLPFSTRMRAIIAINVALWAVVAAVAWFAFA